MTLSEGTREMAGRIIARYPQPRSALLPLLYLCQSEEGYVSHEGIAFCAEAVGLTKAEVQAVSTFYEMFEREPIGDWLLSVCVNYSCKVRGGQEIYDAWVGRLGGTSDPGGRVHVKHLECLGNCEDAPVCQINYSNYQRLTVEEAERLLEAALDGRIPPSTATGDTPPTFREVCWRLAGADDLEAIHAAAVQAAKADVTSYERPPAERVMDEAHDLGAPGVHRPGPEVGDDRGVEEPERREAPAGERLDAPARMPEDDRDAGSPARRPDDAEQPAADEQPIEQQSAPDGEA